jgi:hypothetical protein
VADGARERREAIRQLAELRRRLAAAEDALADALAAMKQAEGAFDAASDRFDAAERALDAAREQRAQARQYRYAARQAYERASAAADRLNRRVRELAERLDRELLPVRGEPGVGDRRSGGGPLPPDVDPPLDQGLVCPGGKTQLSHGLVVGRLGLPFAVAQRQPGAFGQQVGPAVRDLGQLGDRRGIPLPAGPPGRGVPGRDPGDPPVPDAISVQAGHIGRLECRFDLRQGRHALHPPALG